MSGTTDTSHRHSAHDDHAHRGHGHADRVVKDPVCGMSIDPTTAKFSAEHAGETHYFCSVKCHDKFKADPAAYLTEADLVPQADASGTIYTCPMHPQIAGNIPAIARSAA